MLQNIFYQLARKYTKDTTQVNRLWAEIKKAHEEPTRYYHNLQHLENLLLELESIKEKIEDWDTVLWALFYHDFIYEIKQQNNENKSAEYAEKVLLELTYPPERRARCAQHILATKSHEWYSDSDRNFFTDTDLSILGQAPEVYQKYAQQIRLEYAIFSNEIYQKGRKKVLEHFLAMPCIFKSDFFFVKYESMARENLQLELQQITS